MGNAARLEKQKSQKTLIDIASILSTQTIKASPVEFEENDIISWTIYLAYSDYYVAYTNDIVVEGLDIIGFYYNGSYTELTAGGIDSKFIFYNVSDEIVDTLLIEHPEFSIILTVSPMANLLIY